jgi:hypothetical protein
MVGERTMAVGWTWAYVCVLTFTAQGVEAQVVPPLPPMAPGAPPPYQAWMSEHCTECRGQQPASSSRRLQTSDAECPPMRVAHWLDECDGDTLSFSQCSAYALQLDSTLPMQQASFFPTPVPAGCQEQWIDGTRYVVYVDPRSVTSTSRFPAYRVCPGMCSVLDSTPYLGNVGSQCPSSLNARSVAQCEALADVLNLVTGPAVVMTTDSKPMGCALGTNGVLYFNKGIGRPSSDRPICITLELLLASPASLRRLSSQVTVPLYCPCKMWTLTLVTWLRQASWLTQMKRHSRQLHTTQAYRCILKTLQTSRRQTPCNLYLVRKMGTLT